MSCRRKIENSKTAESKCNANRVIHPDSRIVGASVAKLTSHSMSNRFEILPPTI